MMTDPSNQSPQYRYIRVPAAKFPESKFHFGQQIIGPAWEDEEGNLHNDVGEVIGMQYGASGDRTSEWYYLIRWTRCDSHPSLVGSDDGQYVSESSLVADDTAIEG
jgi:hypothetical protein